MIIGISGKAGSGKDAAADVLVRELGFVRVSLADPMKRFCMGLWGFSYEQLWGPSSARNAPDPRFPRRAHGHLECLSPRHALQTLGSEWGRACDEGVWIRYALGVARALEDGGSLRYDPQFGLMLAERPVQHRGVVIPDVRFQNEMDAIRGAGGRVWRVRRGSGLEGSAGLHTSETAQDGIADAEFDAVIRNDGDLADLARAVCLAVA